MLSEDYCLSEGERVKTELSDTLI